MESSFYRPSGRVNFLRLLLWLPVTAAAVAAISVVYAAITYVNPFVYFNAIVFFGMAVASAVTANTLASLARSRNTFASVAIGLLIGSLCIYMSHLYLVSKVVGADLMQLLSDPWALWQGVNSVAANGYYSMFSIDIAGGILWLIWAVEATGIIGFSVFMARQQSSDKVFCEDCCAWATETEGVLVFQHTDLDKLKRQLLASDTDFFSETLPVADDSSIYYSIDQEICEGCDNIFAISLRQHRLSIDKDGKKSTDDETIFEDLLVDRWTYQKIQQHIDKIMATAEEQTTSESGADAQT